MPRLRSMYVGYTTQGETTTARHILVLDDLDQTQAQNLRLGDLASEGVPPILAFGFPVDLPDETIVDQGVTIQIEDAATPDQVAQKLADLFSRQERTAAPGTR